MELANYLARQYRIYLEKRPYDNWREEYEQICTRIANLANRLQHNNKDAFDSACHAIGEEPTSCLREILYSRVNGVASLGQGGISTQTFDALISDADFWPVFVQAVRLATVGHDDDAIKRVYSNIQAWMERFCNTQNANRFPAVINRLFAGCLPGRVSTSAAPGKFSELISNLAANGVQPISADGWIEQNLNLLHKLDDGIDGQQLQDNDPYHRSMLFWWLYETGGGWQEPQIIYYGSPGTGKTFKARELAQKRINAWREAHRGIEEGVYRLIQFHPSFAYEDFIEGIRPHGTTNGQLQLGLVDGVFKYFCRQAARWEIEFYKKKATPLTQTTTVSELPKDIDQAPWQFIIGLPANEKIVDHLPPYVFVIDEINRAELSRVLGETMYSLEYRGYEGKVQTQYSGLVRAASDSGAFLFDDKANYFFVPQNVFMVGTMNVIDRSVEAFDFALRRRFRWIELEFDQTAIREMLGDWDEAALARIIGRFHALNESIEAEPYLGRDYRIGHAYAKYLVDYSGPGGTTEALRFLWRNHLEPLIKEYLRGVGRAASTEEKIEGFRSKFLG
jgi:5-methylcytosine-specific restriction enzyme B